MKISQEIVDSTQNIKNPNMFEEITLSPVVFGTWQSSNIPEKIVVEELSKEIAKRLKYDVIWDKDPRSGHTVAKFSSVVYMKPELKELSKEKFELSSRVEKLEKEIRVNNEICSSLAIENDNLKKEIKMKENKIERCELKYKELENNNYEMLKKSIVGFKNIFFLKMFEFRKMIP